MNKYIEIALQGMDDSFMRINSGICRIIGTTTDTGKNKKDENLFIAFDYTKRLYRCDNENVRTLLVPEYYYEVWLPKDNTPSARRYLPSGRQISPMLNMVDIQMIPFYTPVGIHMQFDYQEKFRKRIFLHKLISYEDLQKDIVYGA